jgi:cellobiose transport system substrate-binding protein
MRSAPRRMGTLVSVLTAVALLATACSSGSSTKSSSANSNEPVTLQVNLFGTFGYKEAGLFDEYQTLHPNVKISFNSVEQEQNYYQALQTHLAAGSGLGDIQGIEVGRIAEIVQTRADKFVNFNDYGGAALKDNFFPWKWQEATTADGRTIGLGTDVGPMAMAYRTDLFKKAGLPTKREEVAKLWATWPDYVRTGQTYMAQAPAGSAFMDSASGMFNAMVGASPNQFYDQGGKPIYDSNPLVRNAWDLSMQAIQAKETAKLKQFDTAWNQAFSTGAFATIAAPSWMIGYIQGQAGAKGAGKWDVTTAPGGTGNWGGSYLAVPTASKQIAQAVDLAKWLTAPEQQVKLFLKQGSFPSSTKAIADPQVANATNKYFNNAPIGQIFGDSAKNLPVAVLGPKDGVIKDTFSTAIQRVEQQGMSPDASYSKFLADIKNALDS